MVFPGRLYIGTRTLLFILFLASGCSSQCAEYSKDWSAVQQYRSPVCLTLAGTYMNEDSSWSIIDNYEYYKGTPLINWFWTFANLNYTERNTCKFVRLSFEDAEILVVELIDNNENIIKKIKLRENEDFRCDEGSIEIKGSSSGLSEAGINVVNSTTSFHKANDGSLTVNYRFSRTGLFALLIPNRVTESEWHKYNIRTSE